MTLLAFIYAFHVLCALVWVGGMFFAWMILRPAAVATLQAPQRLTLWSDVLPRFFNWVWLAAVALPASGIGMLHLRGQTIETAPHFIQVMIGLYLVMLSLFLRAYLLQLPALRKSLTHEDWAAGAAALANIRRLVGFNLLIGITLVSLAAVRPTF